ncbi:hypothetical protein VTN00DRAFT_7058 [Thermoascus crustaceus]|uniref:uncharacterized protein n=1 Tax=Thermoascus crustaceus TaxID=5088 RepID=UPI003743503E
MATRRVQDQSYSEKDVSSPEKPQADSDVTPAVPAGVIYKLLGFTIAMIALPIGMYFLTVDSIFGGNTTFGGITAAITANAVLVAYIVVAWKEDQGERLAEQKRREKKAQ